MNMRFKVSVRGVHLRSFVTGSRLLRPQVSWRGVRLLKVLNPATKRCFSSADTTADVDATKLGESIAVEHLPRPIFPWRHEEELLPRLTPGTTEFQSDIVLPHKAQAFMASIFLNLSFFQAFFRHNWQDDLAESASWAFSQGVAGIVSNVYKVPFDGVSLDEKVNFQFPPESSEEQADDAYCPEVEYMLDRPLRKLYESAHQSGRDQLQIRLQMEPTRCQFFSLFCLPFLSRQAVEENPALLQELTTAIASLRQNPSVIFTGFTPYIERQLMKNGGALYTTVEIQVLIACDEIFQVIDKQTGNVLQGSEDGSRRSVVHLVRLENTVTSISKDTFPYFPTHKLGNWKITDIDDLLGPKKWYQGVLT